VGHWWTERPEATAAVLLPGGKGGIGMQDGAPASENFLVGNRERFAAGKFDVAVVGRPSDQQDLTLFGTEPEAVDEIAEFIRNPKPEPPKS
jgi:hypothetical protein